MTSDSFPRLLGDIGGTHARFAWQDRSDAEPSALATYLCAEYETPLAAIRQYLAEHGHGKARWCAIGIANPVTGDRVQMTNHHWSFSISQLRQDLALERLVVINDFTALALSLPVLDASELRQIGRGTATTGAAIAVLGAGTGLGVSGLVPAPGGVLVPINGEGGHVTLAADNEMEAAVVQHLRQRFGHASAERALSGPGLVNLYEAACALTGKEPLVLRPAEVITHARDGTEPGCAEALQLFCGLLGSVAGNLALTLGARGGVYIGGGIAPRMLAEIEGSSFRARFEAKGRFERYLRDIPTLVITTETSPALIGASRALDIGG